MKTESPSIGVTRKLAERIVYLALVIRWFAGLVWAKQEWRTRAFADSEVDNDLLPYMAEMKSNNWDFMIVIRNKVYHRRFVPRWPNPNQFVAARSDKAGER